MRMSALRRDRRQVAGPRVADGDGRVAARALSGSAGSPSACRRCSSGPTITACAPLVSMPERISICCTPYGRAGRNAVGSPMTSLPTFTGWKPSTSLAGSTRCRTFSLLMCFGSGSCTRMPWIRRIGVEPVDDRRAARPRTSSAGSADRLRVHARLVAGLALGAARRPGSPGPRPRAPPRGRASCPSPASSRDLRRHLRADRLAPAPHHRDARASSGQSHGAGLPDHHDLDLSRDTAARPRSACAIVSAQRRRRASSIRSGVTTTRTSRPAWITLLFSTPGERRWRSPPAG